MSGTYLRIFREQPGQHRVPITALVLLAQNRGCAVSQPTPTTASSPTDTSSIERSFLSEQFMRPMAPPPARPAPRIPSSFSLAAAGSGPNAGVGEVTSQG